VAQACLVGTSVSRRRDLMVSAAHGNAGETGCSLRLLWRIHSAISQSTITAGLSPPVTLSRSTTSWIWLRSPHFRTSRGSTRIQTHMPMPEHRS